MPGNYLGDDLTTGSDTISSLESIGGSILGSTIRTLTGAPSSPVAPAVAPVVASSSPSTSTMLLVGALGVAGLIYFTQSRRRRHRR